MEDDAEDVVSIGDDTPSDADLRGEQQSPARISVDPRSSRNTSPDLPKIRKTARSQANEDLVIVGDDLSEEIPSTPGEIRLQVSIAPPPPPPARPPSAAPRLTEDAAPIPTITGVNPAPAPVDERKVESLIKLAQGYVEKGDPQKAIQSYTDALELRPDRVDTWLRRGRCYLELGDYSSAISDFQHAEDIDPKKPEPHVAMGDLYFVRKEYKRAIAFYDQAVDLDASHAMARCRRGISHFYMRDYRQARLDLQRAFQLDPEIPNIRKYIQMVVKKEQSGE